MKQSLDKALDLVEDIWNTTLDFMQDLDIRTAEELRNTARVCATFHEVKGVPMVRLHLLFFRRRGHRGASAGDRIADLQGAAPLS